jgi:hypothetical protein
VFWRVQSADKILFLARCLCCLPCFPSRIFPDPTRWRSSSWFQTFAVLCMLYSLFRLIPWRLNFICRRFGTHCLLHVHMLFNERSMKMHRKFRRRGIAKRKEYNRVKQLFCYFCYRFTILISVAFHKPTPKITKVTLVASEKKQEHLCRKTRSLHHKSVEHETPIYTMSEYTTTCRLAIAVCPLSTTSLTCDKYMVWKQYR